MIYLLWSKNDYVERDGSREPDVLEGVFLSLEEMNTALERDWFKLPFDTRGISFSSDIKEITASKRDAEGGEQSIYYYAMHLNTVRWVGNP